MMRLAANAVHQFDAVRDGGNLEQDDTLETPVLLSLFSDRRADASDGVPADQARGWWGDVLADVPGDQLGSRLWLLTRAKTLTATLRQAEDFTREALAWLVEDGVAATIGVVATRLASERLGLEVTIERGDGRRWQRFWEVATDAV